MKRYLIILLLLPGCTWLTSEDIQRITTQVDNMDRSIAVVNQTVKELKATSSDPNKYDEVERVAADLERLSGEFNNYVAEVNATDMDPAEVIVTGAGALGKAVTPFSPQAGIGLAALAGLAGIWLRKKKENT